MSDQPQKVDVKEGHHIPSMNPPAPKGILKRQSAEMKFKEEEMDSKKQRAHWDEETLKYIAENKDYGFMKIDEPDTPYHAPSSMDHMEAMPDFSLDEVNTTSSQDGVVEEGKGEKKEKEGEGERDGDVWSDEEHEKTFRAKRKQHYNEYQNAKLARELLAKEASAEEEDN